METHRFDLHCNLVLRWYLIGVLTKAEYERIRKRLLKKKKVKWGWVKHLLTTEGIPFDSLPAQFEIVEFSHN